MSKKLADLRGYVCLVTGSSRGIGRGIALGLGECGATVYITGRTLKAKPAAGNEVGGSLEETAAEINEKGGVAIPVVVDHSNDSEVTELFSRISREQNGRLDILVNNAYAGAGVLSKTTADDRKYWELEGDETPMLHWDAVNGVGLRNHYICSVLATRMMLDYRKESNNESENDKKTTKSGALPRPGIIFNITSFGSIRYLFAVTYGVGKCAIDRMTSDMATELESRKKSVAVLSVLPGIVRTELLLSETKTATKKYDIDLETQTESPEFTGRVIAAIAKETREELLARSGRVFVVADEANSLSIRDIDGRSPISFRSYKFLLQVAGWKRLASVLPSSLKAPYTFVKSPSPRF